MKKKTIILCSAIVVSFLLFTFPVKLYALNYTISFTGTGASTSVESVVVQNLTKGTYVTVPTGNILILSDVATSIDKATEMTNGITIYPNPIQTKSKVTFFAKQAGTSQIDVFGIGGKKVIGLSSLLAQGNNSFQLSLPKGMYSVQVHGTGFSYSLKVISQMITNSKPQINFIGNNNSNTTIQQKSKSSGTNMLYTTGDQLLYKATSGIYSTIVTDVPTTSKTINFDFVSCADADGNNYTTVTIGTQTWMVENLKTTKYNDGTSIPNVTNATEWVNLSTPAYCWYYNDAITYKNKYGALYNWYTVNTVKLAPTGWHVPTSEEWNSLTNYVSAHLGTSLSAAKALAATTDWSSQGTAGTVGCNLALNNSTGFSALPGGVRYNYNVTFFNFGVGGFWWSTFANIAGNAWNWSLASDYSTMGYIYSLKSFGLSVRCVRDTQ